MQTEIQYTPEQLNEMRQWCAECIWTDYEPEEIQSADICPTDMILRAVNKYYCGGIKQFLIAIS